MSETNIQDILISSGITTGVYLLYKSGIQIYKNYYLESECHKNTLQISVKEKKNVEPKEENKEEHKEGHTTELSEIKVDNV